MQDNDNNRYEIHFAKVKYDNPYWISFNLTNKEIEQINKAKTISLVLPESQENMYRYNKKKDKLEKKSYDNDIKVKEMVYELPENIVDEWKTVLNKHK